MAENLMAGLELLRSYLKRYIIIKFIEYFVYCIIRAKSLAAGGIM
jgi:hypothetical protein